MHGYDSVNKSALESENLFVIIDRKAREIITFVASVRPSVSQSTLSDLKNIMTYGIQSKISVCLSVIR